MTHEVLNRRRLLQGLGAGAGLAALNGCATVTSPPRKLGRVLVVGAGFGGATAARYLKLWGGASIEVMLVDARPNFVPAPCQTWCWAAVARLRT